MREWKTVLVIATVAALLGVAVWLFLSPKPPNTQVVQPPPTEQEPTTKQPSQKSPSHPHKKPQDNVAGPDLSKLGKISGKVVCNGAGVANALVQAKLGRQVVASARTDAGGNFTIKFLAAGVYRITAQKAGYAEGSIGGIRLQEGEELSGVVVELERGGAIVGEVLDEAGQPVSGAIIYAWLYRGRRVAQTFKTATDEQGRFRLDNLPQGNYRLRATAKGYLNEHHYEDTTVSADQESEVNFMLRKGASISGTITDETGNPVHRARVTLAKTDGTALFAHQTFSDKNGSFSLTGLPEGTYKLKVWHKEYLPQDAGPFTVRPPDEMRDVRIILAQGATLKGIVMDSDGNPLAGVTVAATSSAPYLYRNTVTDKNGRFVIRGLPNTPLTVSATATRGRFLSWVKRNIRPSPDELRITLTKGASLEGDIVADQPPKRYQILFYLIEGGRKRFAKQAFLQGDTHFVITGIKPARYAVKARAQGYTDSEEQTVDLTSGKGYVRLTLRKK